MVNSSGYVSTKRPGHPFDWTALQALLIDPEITEWLSQMQKAAFVPVKRNG